MRAAETVSDGQGAPAGVEALYVTEQPRLLRLAVLLTGDRALAEDLVHDAFLGLQRHWATLGDATRAAGYLRVTVVNGARSAHRRRIVARRYLQLSARQPEASGEDPAALLAQDTREVVTAVRRLPRRQQEVVVLRYWMDMSEKEIAASMGISLGTVKSTASRALARLERLLGGPDDPRN